MAAFEGYYDIVSYLIESGADVDLTSRNGATALHAASQEGHLEIVRILVDDGKADVDIKMNDGATAMDLAASHGHVDVVKFLLIVGDV